MAEQRRLIISPNRLLDFAKPLPLNPGELHYLQRVLRLKSGAGFNICDGNGTIYLANLCPDGNAQLIKKEKLIPQIKPDLQLFFGLFRRDLEVMLRMATELGVDQLHPLQADYSLLEPGGQRQERWNIIIKEATEQSERAWLPQLAGLQNAATALRTPAAVEECRWIGVTREAGVPPLEKLLKSENAINARHWQLACG
ncbi:MAG: RsmE family RNA methyltransferase, partial [Cyanobacteria bacterium]|nr:RsmE family RNA methyltransferase [Cyanobacteriota bacterium]